MERMLHWSKAKGLKGHIPRSPARVSTVKLGKIMKAINAFLVRQNVDVGRSLSVLTLASAITSFYEMLGKMLSAHLTFDLSIPLGLFVGIALWQHASWARSFLIVLGWGAVVLLTVLLVVIPFTGTNSITLTFGRTRIAHPPLWQVYISGLFLAPAIWAMLCVLHSEKARVEFAKPNAERSVE